MNQLGQGLVGCLLLLCATATSAGSLPSVVSAEELGAQSVHFRGLLPGQALELLGFDQVQIAGAETVDYRRGVTALGQVQRLAQGHHQVTMPASADHLGVDYRVGNRVGRIQLFPLALLTAKTQVIDGYEIGRYPPPAHMGPRYRRPLGLLRVTPDNENERVSPHFRLGQFLCKQEAGWPKYVEVQPTLLRELERLIVLLRARGKSLDSLHEMSGYRTPKYNRSLGNVAYSRHVYGDAADVFVDADGDNWMDDLNEDGVSDVKDAYWLLQLLEDDVGSTPDQGRLGGLSAYPATAHHGPFLHIDMRGHRARWGYQAAR